KLRLHLPIRLLRLLCCVFIAEYFDLCPIHNSKIGSAPVEISHRSTSRSSIAQNSISQSSSYIKEGFLEVGFLNVGLSEVGFLKVGPDEVGFLKVGPDEVGFLKIRLNAWMLFSPLVPNFNTLFELGKMISICHTSCPLPPFSLCELLL